MLVAFVSIHSQDRVALQVAPDADKLTLLKRACLDLTGLPPTLDEIVAFLADTSQDAYERPEHRRSIYVQVRRSKPVSMLQQFDMPAMEPNCEKRSSSTLSTHALTLMNGDFVLAQAEYFARRLIRESGHDHRRQVALAWQRAGGAVNEQSALPRGP